MAEERGPSYWDVAVYAQELEARFGKAVRFQVNPPRRLGPDNRWSSWSVWAEMWTPDGSSLPGPACSQSFGKGGAWATLPAALHAACRNLEARLEQREEDAVRQHRF